MNIKKIILLIFATSLLSIPLFSQNIEGSRIIAKTLLGAPSTTDTTNRNRAGEIRYNPTTQSVYFGNSNSSGLRFTRIASFIDVTSLRSNIYSYLDTAKTRIPIDTIPTSESNNTVTSSGVFKALALKADISHTHTYAQITFKPTTISGFGITDGMTTNTTQTISGGKTFTGEIFMPTVTTIDSSNYPATTAWVKRQLYGQGGGGGGTPGDNTVTNAKLSQMAANTVKANITGSTANATDVTLANFKTWLALVKADVGLGNVDNTSNTTERAATATLTNKTINGSNNTITNIPASALPTVSSSGAGIMTVSQYNRIYTRQTAANPTGTYTFNVNSGAQGGITITTSGARTLAFSNIVVGDLVKIAFDNTSGGTITLNLPSNSFVQGTGSAASVTLPVGKSIVSLSDYDGTNYYFNIASY